MAQLQLEITGDDVKALKALLRVQREQQALEQGANRAGKAAKKAGDDGAKSYTGFGKAAGAAIGVLGPLIGGGGIATGIATIVSSIETWRKEMGEIAKLTQQAYRDTIAFAGLQPEGVGQERAELVRQTAARYGVQDFGQAFDIVQGLQSTLGTFTEGLEASQTVFAASLIGVPLELGKELEKLGYGLGAGLGDTTRRAVIAGRESSSSPQEIAAAVSAFSQFTDHDFAAAVAGALRSGTPAGELNTYTKKAGIALSNTGSLGEYFQQTGLGQATQRERMEALVSRGIDTPDEFKAIGVTEVEQVQALTVLAKNFEQLVRIQEAIAAQNRPGLLMEIFSGAMKDNPALEAAYKLNVKEAEFAAERLTTEHAVPAADAARDQVNLGKALTDQGITQFLGFDLVDSEGKARFGALVLGWLESARQEAFSAITENPLATFTSMGKVEILQSTFDRLNALEAAYQQERTADLSPEGLSRNSRSDLVTALSTEQTASGSFESFFSDIAAMQGVVPVPGRARHSYEYDDIFESRLSGERLTAETMERAVSRGVVDGLKSLPQRPPHFNLEASR